MKTALRLLASAFLLVLLSCSGGGSSPYVRVEDGHFVKNGQKVSFIGTNFWYGAILGSEGQGGDRERLAAELDSLKSLGITNLRVLVGGDGPDGIPTRIEPTLQKESLVYNDTIFAGLDHFLVELGKRDMQAVLFINNAWEWSGGFSMYLEWATGEPALIPAIDGYGPFMRKMADFNVCPEAQELFFENLRHIVSRTNSITGLPYSEDPAIFSWQICNEPRPFSEDEAVVDGFCDWIAKAAAIIKETDPNHMVSTGNEGAMGCNGGDYALVERLNSCPDIDYVTAHIWPFNWGWVSSDCPQGDVQAAIDLTGDYIDRHMELCSRLSKPLVIEEFGFPRDDHQFSKDTPTTGRDEYYSYVFSRVVDSHRTSGSLAGLNFWGWGGLAEQPEGHFDWRRGDDYSGDPAQEEQGLNSVYLTDESTVSLIREAASALTEPVAEVLCDNDWMLDGSKPLRVSVTGVTSPVTVTIDVKSDKGEEECSLSRTLARDGVAEFKLRLNSGFHCVEACLDGKKINDFVIGFGDPEEVVSEPDAADDFDEFWEKSLGELASVDPAYTITPLPEYSTPDVTVSRVDMTSWGGERISAALYEPVAEGKYPAFLNFLGYDCQPYMSDPSTATDRVLIIVCCRRQGWNRDPEGPKDFVYSGLEDPQDFYYHGAFLDCVRGVDLACSRDKVDTGRIFAEGGSQGGAFTLACAALDPRVKGIAPYVPFLCDWPDYFKVASWPANEILPEAERLGIGEEHLLEVLSYFDIKNLSTRILCPVLMGFGLQDDVCPPHTNFAAYNNIPSSDKQWICFPHSGHHVEQEAGWWTARDDFFKRLL